jgi:hypothetical protein
VDRAPRRFHGFPAWQAGQSIDQIEHEVRQTALRTLVDSERPNHGKSAGARGLDHTRKSFVGPWTATVQGVEELKTACEEPTNILFEV